jgi:hypothetical protein
MNGSREKVLATLNNAVELKADFYWSRQIGQEHLSAFGQTLTRARAACLNAAPLRTGLSRARGLLADLFKSRSRLEAENLFLRHQLNIALRRPHWASTNPKIIRGPAQCAAAIWPRIAQMINTTPACYMSEFRAGETGRKSLSEWHRGDELSQQMQQSRQKTGRWMRCLQCLKLLRCQCH